MKTLLVGNGINIQFGGAAYCSEFILKRIKFNALTDKYDILFENTVKGADLVNIMNLFVNVANEIISDRYDCLNIIDNDLKSALKDFKMRYKDWDTKVEHKPHEIMMEDWFLLLKVYILMNPNLENIEEDINQSFQRLFLDSIFNTGEIQHIHEHIGQKAKRFFKSFDEIYTLNYDNNLDALTGRRIYHLHGDFSVLANSENTKHVLGFIRETQNKRVVLPGWEHCFCNALLNYSGELKLKTADLNHCAIEQSNKWSARLLTDVDFIKDFNRMKAKKPDICLQIETKVNHPDLLIATEYYFNKLRRASGEITILGMSPNNDNHIIRTICENSDISSIVYYYYGEKEKEEARKIFESKRCELKDVKKLWKSLDCAHKIYNCNYPNLHNKLKKFSEIFNALSDDEINFQTMEKEINSIPQFEMNRLCKIVSVEMKKFKKKPIDSAEFDKQRRIISSIALREGIYPSVLVAICIINMDNLQTCMNN